MSTATVEAPNKLLAYHGDPKLKKTVQRAMRKDIEADRLVKGQYWENGKGCFIGCVIRGSDHGKFETAIGVPRVLARLADSIFEKLPNGKAMEWPIRFLAAPNPGADLSLVWPRFAVWMLVDDKAGVIQFAKKKTRTAIRSVAKLWQRVVDGELVENLKTEFLADAAAYADAAAADAAAAAAYAAARIKHWELMADKLIELMSVA